jgi:hypothetical protein
MAFDAHKNLAYSAVATAPSPATSGTSLVVTAGQGTLLPTPPFNATVCANGAIPITTNAEIVRVTNISTDTLTITRAQEGTTARAIIVGDQIFNAETAKTLTDIEGNLPQGATNNKVLKSNGTSWAASTETYAVPGTSGNVLTSDGTNWTSARAPSELGYTETSTATTGVTTITDLTGLSVAVTTTTAMTILIEGWIPQIVSTVATDRIDLSIREGSTALATSYATAGVSYGVGGAYVRKRISAPSAGSHTYKLSLTRGAGTGSLSTYCDANTLAHIQVRTV